MYECKSICENSRCLAHCEVKKHIIGLSLLATLVSYKRRTSQYSCYDIKTIAQKIKLKVKRRLMHLEKRYGEQNSKKILNCMRATR